MLWSVVVLGLCFLCSGLRAARRVAVLLLVCGAAAYVLGLRVESALHSHQRDMARQGIAGTAAPARGHHSRSVNSAQELGR